MHRRGFFILFNAIALIVALGAVSTFSILSTPSSTNSQSLPGATAHQSNITAVGTGGLTAEYLLEHPDVAREYGVVGVLVVSSLERGASLTAQPGQIVSIAIVLTWHSFSAGVPTAAVSFATVHGQLSQGQLDISSIESYSVPQVMVGSQPVIVTLVLNIPNPIPFTAGPFPVVPTGLTVSPSNGVVVEYDTQITLDVGV